MLYYYPKWLSGNDNRDACSYSPAAAENAVTVGASTLGDERAYFSNHGRCVDVFGPGLNILSTFKGNPTATATLSGTSMASPHVAGLLAYLLSVYPSRTFDPVFDKDNSIVSLSSQRPSSVSSLYAIAHRALPSFISVYLPNPDFMDILLGNVDDVAPIPKTLSPEQLKKALLALSSKGLLADLPDQTVNLLVFNNYTSASY